MAPYPDSQHLEAELAAARAALEEFAYIVSHDLNTPLRAVVSFSQMLQERYSTTLDERGERYIGHIIHGGRRTQAMLDGLLQYSRLNTTQHIPAECVDTGRIVAHCRDVLQEKLNAIGAALEVGELPQVQADPQWLAKLMFYLLDNSVKFAAHDRPLHIKVSGEEQADGWRFCVRDNGIGISPQHMEEIFKPLKQLHREEEYPGIGMGLALARKIVERHGGRMWAESEPGKGSSFWFTLKRPGLALGRVAA